MSSLIETTFIGKKVLITGAGGGVGSSLAEDFAKAGAILILTDINSLTLEKTANKLKQYGTQVHTKVTDSSKRSEVEALASFVINDVGGLDILINNAGVGHNGDMAHTSIETWKHLCDINFWAPLYHVYAFLPHFIEKKSGHIVNVVSSQTYFRLPTWGAYATIKLATSCFSETLRYEIRHHNINVTTVYPFLINTPFYKDIKGESLATRLTIKLMPLYSMKPESVSKIIVNAIKEKKAVEKVNILNEFGYYLHLCPTLFDISSKLTYALLGKKETHPNKKLDAETNITNESANFERSYLQKNGFKIDESMSGTHKFEEGYGPKGDHQMSFSATCGPNKIADFINPSSDKFMSLELEGNVTVGGLCEKAPCVGTLDLKYFDENKIRYNFTFEVNNKKYNYTGEKINIKPWNLPVSHTTCYGVLTDVETGQLISKSVVYFKLTDSIQFISTLRLVPSN